MHIIIRYKLNCTFVRHNMGALLFGPCREFKSLPQNDFFSLKVEIIEEFYKQGILPEL